MKRRGVKVKYFQAGVIKIYPDIFITFFNYNFSQSFESEGIYPLIPSYDHATVCLSGV